MLDLLYKLLHLETEWRFPLGEYVETFENWLTDLFYYQFRAISDILNIILDGINEALLIIPPLIFILIIFFIAWRIKSLPLGAFVFLSLFLMNNMGYWDQVILTLAMVTTAVLISLSIGIPLGIISAHVPAIYKFLRPILDFMQTIPAYVYLLPAIVLFGLGTVPGIIATTIFSVPPPIRATYLGITEVPKERLEAGQAFGASRWQMLKEIELPSALGSIMLGINQCIMMSLSMVVLAAMIGADGLGRSVWNSLNTLDTGGAVEAGLGIVFIAMILDRLLDASN